MPAPQISKPWTGSVNAAEESLAADRKPLDNDLTRRLVSRSADYGEPYPIPFPSDSPQ